MKIRRATVDDLRGIKEVDPSVGSSRKHLLKEAIRDQGAYVLANRERLLAYAILRRSFFERYFLELVFVHPGHRREGLGGRMMERMEAVAKAKGELWTSTNQSNRGMRRLLASRGYRLAGKISGLDAGDPELFFVRTLEA